MALNPIYLSLHALPNFRIPLHDLRKLNEHERVDYTAVRKKKEELLREYFRIEYPILYLTDDFQMYVQKNLWLTPYALYKALKKKYEGKCWTEWPEKVRTPTEETYEKLIEEMNEEVVFTYFVQFLCHKQLMATKKYASSKGINLMGDLPILISKDSADAWWHRMLFDMEHSAGAPPDVFNKEGQNWGFPVYNWKKFEETEFLWWRRRVFHANQYYDMYRLDHALGFFHLWTIPKGKKAKDGHYSPKKSEGYDHGTKILKVIAESSLMVPVAEDLGGGAPGEAKQFLHKIGIPGICWVRWERDWEGDKSFTPYEKYHPLNLTTISTHDSETLEQWWNEFPEEAKEFCKFKGWKYEKKLATKHRGEILRDTHHTPTLLHINLLQEYLALFPELTWGDPKKERINVPGTVSKKNWTYKFKPSLEELTEHEGLKKKIAEILK